MSGVAALGIGPTYREPVRKASAPTLFLVGLLVLAAVAAITFGVGTVAGLDDDDDGGEVAAAEVPTPTSDPTLTPNQVTVTGVASAIAIEGAVFADDVVVPVVVTPSAGLGAGARFEDVLVDEDPASVTWDAGRPLTMAAETPLRLRGGTPVSLFATPTGMTIGFVDDVAYPIVPGDYEIDAPIAVTTTGLGRSRESVTFTAGEASTAAFTGAANGTMAVAPLAVEGPGRVALQGVFEVHRADGTTQAATAVELPEGSFRVTFAPTADGTAFTLTEALLEGAVTTV
jgi:hypothetical protein